MSNNSIPEIEGTTDEAIILLAHGSRVPEAGRDMEQVANRLKEKYTYPIVEICYLRDFLRWSIFRCLYIEFLKAQSPAC